VKLILISADFDDIRKSYALGIFSGLAGNPSIVAEAGRPSPEMVKKALEVIPDPVFVQVSGLTAEEMIEEGLALSSIDPQRVIVKLPVTAAGIEAIHRLTERDVRTTATAICAANEALLAIRAGAQFLAPYMARISDIGGDGCEVVGDIVELVASRNLDVKVVAASVRTPDELLMSWKLGADFAAVQSSVIWKICSNPAVEAAAQAFTEDYQHRFGSASHRHGNGEEVKGES
jgi:transaldolase